MGGEQPSGVLDVGLAFVVEPRERRMCHRRRSSRASRSARMRAVASNRPAAAKRERERSTAASSVMGSGRPSSRSAASRRSALRLVPRRSDSASIRARTSSGSDSMTFATPGVSPTGNTWFDTRPDTSRVEGRFAAPSRSWPRVSRTTARSLPRAAALSAELRGRGWRTGFEPATTGTTTRGSTS